MSRLARVLLLAAVMFCLVVPSASGAPTNLGKTLGNLWTTALETPTPDNPLVGGGPGSNEAQLRAAAVAADAGITATVTINGQPVPLSSVETGLLTIHLPQDNIFGAKGAERNGLSVAHGFVYLTDPLSPGTYIIEGHVVFPDGSTGDFTTTIIVQ